MSNSFIVHADIIDPNPGRKQDNLIDPVEDSLDGDTDSSFDVGDVLDVQISTQGDRWKSIATVNNIYEDEYGVLVGVNVDWGQATLVA